MFHAHCFSLLYTNLQKNTYNPLRNWINLTLNHFLYVLLFTFHDQVSNYFQKVTCMKYKTILSLSHAHCLNYFLRIYNKVNWDPLSYWINLILKQFWYILLFAFHEQESNALQKPHVIPCNFIPFVSAIFPFHIPFINIFSRSFHKLLTTSYWPFYWILMSFPQSVLLSFP